ncbi:hypothetical protein [Lentzea sp. CC55]|nr:hypothetical protein [Lentzea sp. CC55]MCG8925051.1 hypothetical protein [Lentzea sp. CC55]
MTWLTGGSCGSRRLHRITTAGDVPVSVEGVPSTTVVGDAAHFSAL